ncbi:MAG: hypothetical protein WC197_06830 [Candidatus Gastranaerophilaceae bacterium]|jgi:hypothetical protein
MKKAILTVLTATVFMLFGSTTANAACPCNLGSQSMTMTTQTVIPVVTVPNCGCAAPVCGSYVIRPVKTCCPAAPVCGCAAPTCNTCCPAAPVCHTCCPTYQKVIVSPALPVVFGPPSDCNCR